MDTVASTIIIGISFSVILFLLGAGLTLTMGLMKIVNLAHGAIYMVGAYVGLTAARFFENFILGVLCGALVAALIGIIIEVGFLKRLYKRNQDQALLTIGIVYILLNLVQWIWGPLPQSSYIPENLAFSIPIAGMAIPAFRLIIIGIGVIAAVGLWIFQEKTKIGAIIRAGMDNQAMTRALGISLPIIFSGVFAFGAFIAGFCGLFGGSSLGISLDNAWDVLLLSTAVVMIGGTGTIQGALVGSLLIGLTDTFSKVYFPSAGYFAMYSVLIIVLIIRPAGLLGRKI
jgi:branched-chain amino acid transport system permease protein